MRDIREYLLILYQKSDDCSNQSKTKEQLFTESVKRLLLWLNNSYAFHAEVLYAREALNIAIENGYKDLMEYLLDNLGFPRNLGLKQRIALYILKDYD